MNCCYLIRFEREISGLQAQHFASEKKEQKLRNATNLMLCLVIIGFKFKSAAIRLTFTLAVVFFLLYQVSDPSIIHKV